MSSEPYETGALRFGYSPPSLCLDIPGLSILKGRVTVIAGPNGSGKTTLLKLLSGLITTRNNLTDREALSTIQRDAVYLHQTPYLFKGSVKRNLALALGGQRRNAEPDSRQKSISEALDSVGLSGFEERRARSLSGGEAKRVALARVFLSNRPLMLLDEPAAHADSHSVGLIESACRSFAVSGRTIVVATHRGGFAYRVADILYDLQDGLIKPSARNILNGEGFHDHV